MNREERTAEEVAAEIICETPHSAMSPEVPSRCLFLIHNILENNAVPGRAEEEREQAVGLNVSSEYSGQSDELQGSVWS